MSGVYIIYREKLLEWAISGSVPANLVVMCCGVDGSYTFSNVHEDLAALDDSIVAPGVELTGVSTVNGILDADDAVFAGLDPGPTIVAAVIYFSYDGGTTLIAYIDESTNSSLPYELLGSDFEFKFNSSGICR